MDEFFEKIVEDIHTKLPVCFTDEEMTKQQFIRDFTDHTGRLGIRLGGLENVYPLPFQIVDHLAQCQIRLQDDERFIFPLERMHCPKLHMFFIKKKAPNLVMFLPNHHPSALFTKRGFVTLAGGKNESEITECFLNCCGKLLFVLKKLYPNKKFILDGFRLCNKVATTTLVLHKIFTAGFIDLLRKHRIKVRYNQDIINFSFVKQSIPFRPSITFCVSAKGGINILGFIHDYEAQYAALLLSYFLKPNLIQAHPNITKSHIKKAELEVKKKREKETQKKYLKKRLRMAEWLEDSSKPHTSTSV
jgi:hypothetical protein